jgi:hypothetical protein
MEGGGTWVRASQGLCMHRTTQHSKTRDSNLRSNTANGPRLRGNLSGCQCSEHTAEFCEIRYGYHATEDISISVSFIPPRGQQCQQGGRANL